jgi:hypothetical protein
MSKPRRKKPVNSTAARGHQLPARVREPMWGVLKALAADERRSVAQTVVILLEEALRGRGVDVPRQPRGEDN